MHIIITGPKGAGKSAHLLMLADALKKQHKTVGGVISRGFWNHGEREGYEIVNPATGVSRFLCGKTKPANANAEDIMPFCSYFFLRSSFAEGNRWIAEGLTADVLFIDEVGNIELSGGGWNVNAALTAGVSAVLGVREDAVQKLASTWGIRFPVMSISPGANILDDIVNMVLNR
jgi:nucleoside-triphosphatase THEP1